MATLLLSTAFSLSKSGSPEPFQCLRKQSKGKSNVDLAESMPASSLSGKSHFLLTARGSKTLYWMITSQRELKNCTQKRSYQGISLMNLPKNTFTSSLILHQRHPQVCYSLTSSNTVGTWASLFSPAVPSKREHNQGAEAKKSPRIPGATSISGTRIFETDRGNYKVCTLITIAFTCYYSLTYVHVRRCQHFHIVFRTFIPSVHRKGCCLPTRRFTSNT